jgi:adenine phosphoribosyltransferase
MTDLTQELKMKIRDIPDWPKKGIVFRDITTLLKDGKAFKQAIAKMAEHFKNKNIDLVVSTEARGFIFGAPLAIELGAGFVPVRKPGKLPCETLRTQYELEYGCDAVEIHKDGIESGKRVLIVDDLLATGGTISATAELVKKLGGEIVGFCFLIELASLKGREKLAGYDVWSLIKYD